MSLSDFFSSLPFSPDLSFLCLSDFVSLCLSLSLSVCLSLSVSVCLSVCLSHSLSLSVSLSVSLSSLVVLFSLFIVYMCNRRLCYVLFSDFRLTGGCFLLICESLFLHFLSDAWRLRQSLFDRRFCPGDFLFALNSFYFLSRPLRGVSIEQVMTHTHPTFIIHHPSFIIHHSSFIIHHPSFNIIIHHSTFIIHHSSFIIHHSSSIIHHPSFNIHRSSFIIQHSSFIIHHPSSIIQHSSFNIHRSSFITQHSSFIIHRSSFITQHSSFNIQHDHRDGGQQEQRRIEFPIGCWVFMAAICWYGCCCCCVLSSCCCSSNSSSCSNTCSNSSSRLINLSFAVIVAAPGVVRGDQWFVGGGSSCLPGVSAVSSLSFSCGL